MRRPIQHAMACHLRLWGILPHVDPCGFVVSQLLNHPNNAKTPKIMEALSEGLQLHVAEFWFIVQPHSPIVITRHRHFKCVCVNDTARIWHVTDNGPFHSDKAFLSNTAIVTMMIPVIVSWSRTLGVHPGKLLMPLSFAAARRQQWRWYKSWEAKAWNAFLWFLNLYLPPCMGAVWTCLEWDCATGSTWRILHTDWLFPLLGGTGECGQVTVPDELFRFVLQW